MAVEVLRNDEMLSNSYEPLRQHRWVFSIDQNDIDGYTARSWARPVMSMGETVIDYINEKRYLAGKAEPQSMTLTLNDPIAPSQSQAILRWIGQHYEQASGRAGYAEGTLGYKRRVFLKMLDPNGAAVQTWELKGTWIQNVDFGTLDYTSAEPVNITLTLRFDKFEVTQAQ